MTTRAKAINKPGNINQKPLYGCTGCYEDFSWPAGDLRVYETECWCEPCWDERRWTFPGLPYWDDLEPYTPALQAECERLRKDVAELVDALECMIIGACAVAVPHNGERAALQDAVNIARAALAAHRKQGGEE